jgi:hypothetical protein
MSQKRFLFSLTDKEALESTKLCDFACKLPCTKKSGDSFEDDELTMKRDAFAKTIDKLWRHPGIIMQTCSWVEKRVLAIADKVGDDKFESVSVLKNIEDEWLCNFLHRNFKFEVGALELVCNSDPESMLQLLIYGMVASSALKLPEACKHKQVMEDSLKMVFAEHADRLGKMEKKDLINKTSRTLDWLAIGVYSVVFDAKTNLAERVIHRPTGDEALLEDHVRITKAFVLESNWSDHLAAFVLKPSRYLVLDLFEENSGPHHYTLLTGKASRFDTIVRQAHAKIQRERPAVAGGKKKKFREDEKKVQKQDNMSKARRALSVKKKDLANKRVIKF